MGQTHTRDSNTSASGHSEELHVDMGTFTWAGQHSVRGVCSAARVPLVLPEGSGLQWGGEGASLGQMQGEWL